MHFVEIGKKVIATIGNFLVENERHFPRQAQMWRSLYRHITSVYPELQKCYQITRNEVSVVSS